MTDYIGGVRYQPAFAPDLGRGEDWTDRIACKDADPHLFDAPERPETPTAAESRLATARTFCNGCPVAAPCLMQGKEDGAWGIRGGLFLERGRPIAHARYHRPRNGAA